MDKQDGVDNINNFKQRFVRQYIHKKEFPIPNYDLLRAIHKKESDEMMPVHDSSAISLDNKRRYFKDQCKLIEMQKLPYLQIVEDEGLGLHYPRIDTRLYDFLREFVEKYSLTHEEASALATIIAPYFGSFGYFPLREKDKKEYENYLNSASNKAILNSKEKISDATQQLMTRNTVFFQNFERALTKLLTKRFTNDTVYRGLNPNRPYNKVLCTHPSSYEKGNHGDETYLETSLQPGSIVDTPTFYFTPDLRIAQRYFANIEGWTTGRRILELKNSSTVEINRERISLGSTVPEEILSPPGKMQITDIQYYPDTMYQHHNRPKEWPEVLKALDEAQQAGTMKNFDWGNMAKLLEFCTQHK